MKKQNMFFAIVMISFTSTFMSCQKEALITNDLQANTALQSSYEIPIDNEVQKLKTKIDPIPSDYNDATNVLPVKFTQDVCLNGGVTLNATHPTYGLDFYQNTDYKFQWLDSAGYIAESNGSPTLSCVCSGTYVLQIIGKGNVIETYKVNVKASCSGDIPDETI